MGGYGDRRTSKGIIDETTRTTLGITDEVLEAILSKLQQVIDAIKDRFATITKANGYNCDLGSNVFEWRDLDRSPFSVDEMPALNLKDPEMDIYVEAIGTWTCDVVFNIEAFCTKGSTTASEIRTIIDCILRAIGADETFGGLTEYVEFDSSGQNRPMKLEIAQDEKTVARASFRLRLVYRTNYWEL